MLKQGEIQLDKRQIDAIRQRQRQKVQQSKKVKDQKDQHQRDSKLSNDLECDLIRSQVFPTEFVPFCIDEYSKESSLKLYLLQKSKYNLEKVNQRIKIFYQTINSFKQTTQKQKIISIFRINQLQQIVSNLNEQTQNRQQYFSYFQQGKSIEKVQIWRFKHTQDKPIIAYQLRQQMLKDFQLILRLISRLVKSREFQHIDLNASQILMLQYDKCNQVGCEYQFKLKCKWIFDMILNSNSILQSSQLLENFKKILRKLLCISQQKSNRSQLDQVHYQNIGYLTSLEDIIKLKYHDFYFNKKPKQSIPVQQQYKSLQNKEELQKLKQQILYLEQLAKKQFKDFKLVNTQPKIKEATKQANKQLWTSIERYILSNVTESQRKIILSQGQKKVTQQAATIKKPQKKLTTLKKETKPQVKQVPKQQKKEEFSNANEKTTAQKEIVVQANFLASGSDLKFRPERLMQLIESKQSILYLLKTKNKTSNDQNLIACFVNAKPSKQNSNIFGSYCADLLRKSFIYSQKTEKFYKLLDKNYSVGYGPQIFLSIGKLDIIIPCFGTQIVDNKQVLKCMSYFPISYSSKGIEMNGLQKVEDEQIAESNQDKKENEIGLQKQFFLQEIDIYQIKLKAQ